MLNCIGGAPNYFPNSFTGPMDDRKYALSKTLVVGVVHCCVMSYTCSKLLVIQYMYHTPTHLMNTC